MTFEERIARLEAIVAQLNDSRLDLSKSIELFEEGVKHLGLAHQELAKIEGTVGRLTEREDGRFDVIDG